MKFLLTPELGRLVKWLRAVGYDAEVFKGRIPDLLAKATADGRIILTRHLALSGHRGTPVRLIRNDRFDAQLKELRRSCGIRVSMKQLFLRCLLCNVPVKRIAKEKAEGKVPPYVFRTQKDFSQCPSCKRFYWAATHWQRASKILKTL